MQLERFVKAAPDFTFHRFRFADSTAADMSLEVGSESSSSDSSSDPSTNEEVEAPQPKEARKTLPSTDADEILIGRYRSVAHALVKASDGALWRPQWEGFALKPACGRQMKGLEAEMIDHLDISLQLCQHAACRKIWQACRFMKVPE